MYSLVSQYSFRIEATEEIIDFQKNAKQLPDEEVIEKIELAKAYNAVLDPSRLADPYTEKEKQGIAEYARMLEVNEKMGFVEIPKIDANIPIYAGTSEEVLAKGAGHLEGTSLPVGGESTHTVITAHRGLPTAELFHNLDKLKKGDVFYLHNIETVLAYEVDQILTVEPSNFDPVLVVKGKDFATLLTCTPYMINSHRLLVRGHKISYTTPAEYDNSVRRPVRSSKYKDLIVLMIPIAVVLLLLAIYFKNEIQKKKKKLAALEKEKQKRDRE